MFLLGSLRKTLRMVWRHDLAGNGASVREHYIVSVVMLIQEIKDTTVLQSQGSVDIWTLIIRLTVYHTTDHSSLSWLLRLIKSQWLLASLIYTMKIELGLRKG